MIRAAWLGLPLSVAGTGAVVSAADGGLQRLYVLHCGQNTGRDQSRCWTPGINEGKSIDFSNNCYLIRHAKGLLLWDSGVPDAVATMHLHDNWVHQRVAAMNADRDQTLASLDRLARLVEEYRAQPWIGHDKAQSDGLRYAPAYYE